MGGGTHSWRQLFVEAQWQCTIRGTRFWATRFWQTVMEADTYGGTHLWGSTHMEACSYGGTHVVSQGFRKFHLRGGRGSLKPLFPIPPPPKRGSREVAYFPGDRSPQKEPCPGQRV